MKSFIISNLLLGAMLTLLASCGESKVSKTNFVVSQNFSIVNSSYEGGLSIYGKNLDTGEDFAYSSLPNGGQNQIVLDLQKGNWSFGVVGWSGGGTDNNLKGTPYCGAINSVNLNSNEQTVNLSATQAGCLTDHFASSAIVDTVSTPFLKSLVLNICPEIADGVISSSVTFCKDKQLDESLGNDIWSIKIQLPSKALTGTTSKQLVQTACITTSSLGNFDLGSAPYRIPTKNFPLNIISFKDKNCQVPSNIYAFERGLEASYGFDKKFIFPVGASTPKMFLASTKSKSEGSALAGKIPDMKCGTTSDIPCGFMRTLPSGEDYIISSNSIQEIMIDPFYTCSSIGSVTGANGITIPSTDYCRDGKDGKGSIVKIILAGSSSCVSAVCTIGFSIQGGTLQSKSIKQIQAISQENLGDQERIAKYLGINNPDYNQNLVLSLPNLDSIKKSSGILADIKEMLSSNVIGGAYKDISSCSSLTGIRYLDVIDEGSLRRYQTEVVSISETMPRQICAGTLSGSGCSSTFDKKIILRRFDGPVAKAQKIIKIDCDSYAGMSEVLHNESNRLEKKITYWNVPAPAGAIRIQEYAYEKEMSGSSTILVRTRAAILSRSSANDPLKIVESNYDYNAISATPSESISKKEISIDNSASGTVYSTNKQYQSSSPASAGEIFTLSEVSSLLKEESINQHSPDIVDLKKIATSPNGNYKLFVNFNETGTNYTYKVVSDSSYVTGTGSLNSTYSKGDISINDSGKIVIAYAYSTYIKFITFSATDTSTSSSTIAASNFSSLTSPKRVKVYLGNDDNMTLSYQTTSGLIVSNILTLSGSLAPGNMSGTYNYESTSMPTTDDFIIHHTSPTQAKLCYATISPLRIKCIKIKYPTSTITSASGLASYSGPLSGTNFPIINLINLPATSPSVMIYLDPSCSAQAQVSPTSVAASDTTAIVSTTNANPGFNMYYYKINSGVCTSLNISYHYSLTGRYEESVSESSTFNSGVTYIDPKFTYNSLTDETVFNIIIGNNNFYKITSNGIGAVTPYYSVGATLSVNKSANYYSKSSDISASDEMSLSNYEDADQADVPIKYPTYNGNLSGLKPQTFLDVFTAGSVFEAQ